MTLAVQGVTKVGEFMLDIDIVVESETVAVVGDNGVGKTTLLKVVAGLQRLVAGTARLGQIVLDEPSRSTFVLPQDRDVALLFQDSLLFPHLDVVDNVAFGLRRHGVDPQGARRLARSALERFGVIDLAERRVESLSGGQAQRVSLARAAVREPRMVLLDEPFSSLDRSSRAEFRRLLADQFVAMDAPRLIVTHDDADIDALCSRQITVTLQRPGHAVAR